MKPEAILIELLERVAAKNGEKIFITDHELSLWADSFVVLMKSCELITKAPPAVSTLCMGCERECVMPVHILTNAQDEPKAFIVCDKRRDINRVFVPLERLEQWQISGESIGTLLIKLLDLPNTTARKTDIARWEIGVLRGTQNSSHIILLIEDHCKLVLAGHDIKLAEVLSFEKKAHKLKLNKNKLVKLIDHPATGGGDIISAEERREQLKKRKKELIAQGHRNFIKIITLETGLSEPRIKQLLK